jgi:tRNA uridine 5-carboxymethylaminomethyl modification enzyme
VPGISIAERGVLKVARPESLGQARRVEGVTPAGALRLLAYLKKSGLYERDTIADLVAAEGDGLDMETVDAKARVSEL